MLRPQLLPMLRLHPPPVHQQYHSSPTFRMLAVKLDLWTTWFSVATNALFMLRKPLQYHSDCLKAATHGWYILFLVAASIQAAWLHRAPRPYLRVRGMLLLLNRLLRTAFLLFLVLSFRRNVSQGCHPDCLASGARAPLSPASPSATALRSLLFSSMAILPFFHGVSLPLEFAPQLLLQLLQFLLLLAFQVAPVMQAFRHSQCMAPLQHACQYVHTIFHKTQSFTLVIQSGAPDVQRICTQDTLQVLVLFLLAYFVVALPAYVAYRVDRRMKEHFLVALRALQPASVDLSQLTLIPVPHVLDLLMAFALAVTCWVVVINFHGLFMLLAVPVGG